MKTGVQQIQFRSILKKEETADAALKAMKESGYDGIELNRFMIHKLPLHIRLLTKAAGMEMGAGGNLNWHSLIEKNHLEVLSLHCDLGTLEKNPEEVIAEAQSYHTNKIVLTGMYHYDYSDAEAVTDLIKRLNAVGKRLKEDDMMFFYHNHNCEFLEDSEHRKAYDRIIDETDPDFVNFEFDSYWAIETGADPLVWMKKLGTRMKLYHINDRGCRAQGKTGSILKSDGMELGTGNMDLDAYLKQAEENQCEAVILETHRNWIHNDPIESMQISGKFLVNQR